MKIKKTRAGRISHHLCGPGMDSAMVAVTAPFINSLTPFILTALLMVLPAALPAADEPGLSASAGTNAAEYPYWGAYKKTPNGESKADAWVNNDYTREGWDWSLPPETKASPKGLMGMARVLNAKGLGSLAELPKVNFECNPIVDIWFNWNTIEATEGVYDFSQIKKSVETAAGRGYGTCVRLMTSNTKSAPQWLRSKYNVPLVPIQKKGGEGVENYDVSYPQFHDKYRQLVAAFGESGIPAMKEVKGLYVGYASPSNGDEGIGPHKIDPDTVPHVRERLDAWAAITQGIEYKVYMGGNCNYGFSKGFGVRRGFVEMYLYQIPSPEIGQVMDQEGYLKVDETCPLIAKECLHGEVNEEYDERWATPATKNRYGDSTVSFPYRYFTSSLRLLQMRVNLACYSDFTLIPAMVPWISLEVGRIAKTAPDAWCFLRESYLKSKEHPVVKNFERWVYQRDSAGYETTPVVKIEQPIKMWMVDPGKYYDFIARTGNKIGFNVDKDFLTGSDQKVAIKITYFDEGEGTWLLLFNGVNGRETREVKCSDSKKLLTATFFVTAGFNQNKSAYDFECVGQNGLKPVISFVRIVK